MIQNDRNRYYSFKLLLQGIAKAWKICLLRFRIPCACPACVYQLDKSWLPNCVLSSQPRYSLVENCYYNKVLEHYNDFIIM